jgi:GNAT superfamily N-acetyltransferase
MLVDQPLVERVESASVEGGLAIAAAMAAVAPASGATAMELGGGCLVFTGIGMYVNCGFGLGMRQPLVASDADPLVAFFTDRGVPPEVELCPWADSSSLALLASHGFAPNGFRDVFVRRPERAADIPSSVHIEEVRPETFPVLLQVRAEGFSATQAPARDVSDRFSRAAAAEEGRVDLLAYLDSEAVGSGTMRMHGGVATLGGMSTVPAFRGRGVQSALLRHRLHLAAERGCDLVVVTALPNSASARNIRRHGFALAYTLSILRRV